MPLSEFAVQNLVPFILDDPYHSGPDLIKLFNQFGCRDVYNGGLPVHPRMERQMSRKEYVEVRLNEIPEFQKVNLLSHVINNSENKVEKANVIYEVIREDGYTIELVDGNYVFIGGVIDRSQAIQNQAHFQQIENTILSVLDEAQVSIRLVIAWFTNERLRDKLLDKLQEGVDIRIAIYADGINRAHGVDLTPFDVTNLPRGTRGGLMHDKFCVIDNQVVITGSYNWTDNAEYRNDENIVVLRDPVQATNYSVEFRRLTT